MNMTGLIDLAFNHMFVLLLRAKLLKLSKSVIFFIVFILPTI